MEKESRQNFEVKAVLNSKGKNQRVYLTVKSFHDCHWNCYTNHVNILKIWFPIIFDLKFNTFLHATFLNVFPHWGHGSWVERCDSRWLTSFFFVSKLDGHLEQGNEAVPEWTFRWSFKSRECLNVFRQTSHESRSPKNQSQFVFGIRYI